MSVRADDSPPIGQLFLDQGRLSVEQLDSALAQQRVTGELLGEILVARGHISRLDLASAIGAQWYWQPPVDESGAADRSPDPEGAAVPETGESRGPYQSGEQLGVHRDGDEHDGAWADLRHRVDDLERRSDLIASLELDSRQAGEHRIAVDARLQALEAWAEECAATENLLRNALEVQAAELEALRAKASKADALANAVRAFFT
jgi:hypothetical protein